jgi:hypothetical protein
VKWLTDHYTLRVRRIYVLLIVLFVAMQAVTLAGAYLHLVIQEEKASRQSEAFRLQLRQDMRTLTMSRCFQPTDACLEYVYQVVRLPDGTPAERVLHTR